MKKINTVFVMKTKKRRIDPNLRTFGTMLIFLDKKVMLPFLGNSLQKVSLK